MVQAVLLEALIAYLIYLIARVQTRGLRLITVSQKLMSKMFLSI